MSTLDQFVEGKWLVSEIIKRSPPIIVEDEPLASLMENFPKDNASVQDWKDYKNFILGIQDPIQICVAYENDEELRRISIAEGNHRLYILYNLMINPVQVKRVPPERLGELSLERTMGKPQALHFRLLLDLNYQLEYILKGLGYDTRNYDDTDFTLLKDIIQRLRYSTRNDSQSSNPAQTRAFSSLKNLMWLYREEINRLIPTFLDGILSDNRNSDPDPDALLTIKSSLSLLASDIFETAINQYLNRDSYIEWVTTEDYPMSAKKNNINKLINTALDRALLDYICTS